MTPLREQILGLVAGTVLAAYFIYGGISAIDKANENHKHHAVQVFKNGYNCAGAGIPVQANPHQEGTRLHTSWDRGWIAGKMKVVNICGN